MVIFMWSANQLLHYTLKKLVQQLLHVVVFRSMFVDH